MSQRTAVVTEELHEVNISYILVGVKLGNDVSSAQPDIKNVDPARSAATEATLCQTR